MGTWAIPYKSLESACLFMHLMKKPWIAQVAVIPDCGNDSMPPEGETVSRILSSVKKKPQCVIWDAPFLHQLVGSDSLSDDLQLLAQRKRNNFDIRPIVKKFVTTWVKEEDGTLSSFDIVALKIVRDSLGLSPLAPEEEKIISSNAKPKSRRLSQTATRKRALKKKR